MSLLWPGYTAWQIGRAQTYIATDLGAPASGLDSEAHAINRNGNVVGIWWTLSSDGNAFRYRNGTNTDLGNIGNGKYSIAYAINNTNLVVGQSSISAGLKASYHAFIFTNNSMVDLGALGDSSWSSANALNKNGLIAGESITASGNIHAVLFQSNSITDLGTLSNGVYSTALGLNDSGVVVGNATVTISPGVTNTYGFIYSNSVMNSVGTLGGDYSTAAAINNAGQVVGESTTASGETHAYIFSGGTMTDLGTLGGTYSTATAINNFGQVTGYAYDAGGNSHAFLHNGTTMINLDNALVSGSDFSNLALGYGINDVGQMVGGGYNTNGHYVAFLLTPVATPLIINCSTNLTATATSSNGAVVSFTVTASGGCSSPSVVANPPSGSTFPVGMTTVTTTASDVCGSSTNCSFTVTVNPPLAITCSSNITVTATNANGATVFFTVSASGGSSSSPTITANPPSGSLFPVGTNTVTSTASDTCGQTNICSFTVTVNPPLTPVIVKAPMLLNNNQFQMTIQGVIGQHFAIQASTNFVNWTSLNTNTLVSASTNWLDADVPTNNYRFYRAVMLP